MTRDEKNQCLTVLSILLALLSLGGGLYFLISGHSGEELGKYVVGFWILVPPIYLWWDWVVLCDGMEERDREIAKHTHDLARNIWLGFVAVLAVLYGVKFPGTG
jgi:hypothetical protein